MQFITSVLTKPHMSQTHTVLHKDGQMNIHTWTCAHTITQEHSKKPLLKYLVGGLFWWNWHSSGLHYEKGPVIDGAPPQAKHLQRQKPWASGRFAQPCRSRPRWEHATCRTEQGLQHNQSASSKKELRGFNVFWQRQGRNFRARPWFTWGNWRRKSNAMMYLCCSLWLFRVQLVLTVFNRRSFINQDQSKAKWR